MSVIDGVLIKLNHIKLILLNHLKFNFMKNQILSTLIAQSKLSRLELKNLIGGRMEDVELTCNDGSKHTLSCTGGAHVEVHQQRYKCHSDNVWTYPCPVA